jgi:adenine-specific DNA-methyltransferase
LALFQQAEKNSPNDTKAQDHMLAELLLKSGLGTLGVDAITQPKKIAGITIHRILLADERTLWLCFEPYNDSLKDEIIKAKPAQVMLLNSCFNGAKADEQIANLQLELSGCEINLTII